MIHKHVLAFSIAEEKTTPWPKFDKAVSELHDWLSLVEDVIKNQRIMLGNVDEMQRLTNKQKQVSVLTCACLIIWKNVSKCMQFKRGLMYRRL